MQQDLAIAAIQSISIAGNIAANVARHVRLASAAAERGAKLALFPELSLTGYELAIAHQVAVRHDDPRLDPLRALARESGITIAAGAPMVDEGGNLHIAALSFRPDGGLSIYTKQHLHGSETDTFVPGDGGDLLQIQGQKAALAVCADIAQASHPQQAWENGAALYAAGVLITDNGYAADTALLTQYAKRYAMPVMMANHGAATGGWQPAGRSAIWDAAGELLAAAPGAGECLVLARRDKGGWHGQVLAIG